MRETTNKTNRGNRNERRQAEWRIRLGGQSGPGSYKSPHLWYRTPSGPVCDIKGLKPGKMSHDLATKFQKYNLAKVLEGLCLIIFLNLYK